MKPDRTYDLESLLTLRIFTQWHGSVFKSFTLWFQTVFLAIFFWFLYLVVLYYRPAGFSEVVGNEASIRAFIAMFSMLIGLLLSFYTALNLNRWWQMRMGIEAIQDGCKKLVMMVSQVSSDETLIDSITRYARASLFLIFASSQRTDPHGPIPAEQAYLAGLLTEDEKTKLVGLNPTRVYVQAETLWVWLANAVTRLHDEGLTKGPPHYCMLMATIEAARAGISSIEAYLATPIPFGYVHLLCMMVKLHNFLLTILMALTCVVHSGGHKGIQPVSVFRTAFRAFFMPFLYNALLILNAQMTDPFGGDESDFDWSTYDVSIAMSAHSYAQSAHALPDWIAAGNFKPAKRDEASTV